MLSSLLEVASAPVAWTFTALCGLTGALYVLTYVAPGWMVRLHSVPWAFHLERNVDLRYQSVLYGAFHMHPWSQVTHWSIAWDQVAWFVLLWAVHPALVALVVAGLMIQALLLHEPRLAALLGVVWGAVAALGWGLLGAAGAATAVPIAMAVLVLGGVLRFVGHFSEPIPPGMVRSDDRFHQLREARLTPGVVLGPIVGIVSEFAAALPFRLFLVQVFWLGDRLGLGFPHWGSWREHREEARRVHEDGWRAAETTAWMAGEEARAS